jgi:hypothetical protein
MSSTIVAWTGRCRETHTRTKLLGYLQRLAERSEALRPPPRADIEGIDQAVTGQILVSSEIAPDPRVFIDHARDAGLPVIAYPKAEGVFLTLIEDAHLRGLDFKLFEPRKLYPGADRLSFMFLECPNVPFLDGSLVQVENARDGEAQTHDIIRAAACCLGRPKFQLPPYLEDWTDLLFSWVKFFHIGDLGWHRNEPMQGYAEYRGILLDLQNELGPDRAEAAAFDALLATYANHAEDRIASASA